MWAYWLWIHSIYWLKCIQTAERVISPIGSLGLDRWLIWWWGKNTIPCFLFFGKATATTVICCCLHWHVLYMACITMFQYVNIFIYVCSSNIELIWWLYIGMHFANGPYFLILIHTHIPYWICSRCICDAKLTSDAHRMVRDIKKETIT